MPYVALLGLYRFGATMNNGPQDKKEPGVWECVTITSIGDNFKIEKRLCELEVPRVSFGSKAVIRPLPNQTPENQPEINNFNDLRNLCDPSKPADLGAMEYSDSEARKYMKEAGGFLCVEDIFLMGDRWRFEKDKTHLKKMHETYRKDLGNWQEADAENSRKSYEQTTAFRAEIAKLRAENEALKHWEAKFKNANMDKSEAIFSERTASNKLTCANAVITTLEKDVATLKDVIKSMETLINRR